MTGVTYTSFILDTETRLIQLVSLPTFERQWHTPFRHVPEPVSEEAEPDLFVEIAQTMFSFDIENVQYMRSAGICVFLIDDDSHCLSDALERQYGKHTCMISGWDAEELRRIQVHPVISACVKRFPMFFDYLCDASIDLQDAITVSDHASP